MKQHGTLQFYYTEAKVDVTQEIEQAAQAGADHCTLCSISCVTSTLASVYVKIADRCRLESSRLIESESTDSLLQP